VQKNEKISGASKNSAPKKGRAVKNNTKQTASAKKSTFLFHALFFLLKKICLLKHIFHVL